MLTTDEVRALSILAVLVAAGVALSVLERRHPDVLALTLGDSLALGFERAADPAPAPAPARRSAAPARADSTTPPDSLRTPGDSLAASAYAPDGRLDLNRATAEDFEALPGVGPKTAERIVADRAKRGRFKTVKDLGRVKGIGPKTLARLTPHVCVLPARKG